VLGVHHQEKEQSGNQKSNNVQILYLLRGKDDVPLPVYMVGLLGVNPGQCSLSNNPDAKTSVYYS